MGSIGTKMQENRTEQVEDLKRNKELPQDSVSKQEKLNKKDNEEIKIENRENRGFKHEAVLEGCFVSRLEPNNDKDGKDTIQIYFPQLESRKLIKLRVPAEAMRERISYVYTMEKCFSKLD